MPYGLYKKLDMDDNNLYTIDNRYSLPYAIEGMDSDQLLEAVERVGRRLADSEPGMPVVRLLVVGGVAGMLTKALPAERTTTDCDVMDMVPPDRWDAVRQAAAEVGRELGLKPTWLNRDSRAYQHVMAAGWQSRCIKVGVFGKLDVRAVGRTDLIVAKVMGAAQRVQDREDLRCLKPTAGELDKVLKHLDRLEAESLDRQTFEPQRAVVAALRMEHDKDQ